MHATTDTVLASALVTLFMTIPTFLMFGVITAFSSWDDDMPSGEAVAVLLMFAASFIICLFTVPTATYWVIRKRDYRTPLNLAAILIGVFILIVPGIYYAVWW